MEQTRPFYQMGMEQLGRKKASCPKIEGQLRNAPNFCVTLSDGVRRQGWTLKMGAMLFWMQPAWCLSDGTPFVCYWAHVTVGQPAADAAMMYMLLTTEFPEERDKYLDLFSKKADVAKQQISCWLPVVAAAELSRNRKGDEEFLQSWTDVASDYD